MHPFTGVTAKDFSTLWISVLVRVLCCAIPATAAFILLPKGGPADAVSDFQVSRSRALLRLLLYFHPRHRPPRTIDRMSSELLGANWAGGYRGTGPAAFWWANLGRRQ